MLLSELLRSDLIKVHLEAESKREAIAELVDVLVQAHEISLAQRPFVLDAVLANEAALGSGLERGIAIPHGRTDRVEDLLCALGTAPRGIPFESRDGKPADLVILLVVPKRSFSAEIGTLAGIAHLLGHGNLKDRIVAARDAQSVYDLLCAEEVHA